MEENGYVYVLMNPSMENLVKIGKSTKDPTFRAKELSSTTGVPTPFSVVYDCYFENCTAAELFVHSFLENKGYRVSKNREFFEIPIKDAIDAIMKAKEHFGEFIKTNNLDTKNDEIPSSETDDKFLEDLDFEEEDLGPGQELFEIGENYYYGWEGELQDFDEAIEYYEKALKLGFIKAYRKIGTMYNLGESVKENNTKAFKYFKEGAKRGDVECYAEMGQLFNEQDNIENALKSWKRYFELSNSIEVIHAVNYIEFIDKNNLELGYKDKLLKIKDEIIDLLTDARNNATDKWGDDYYKKKIKLIKNSLNRNESSDNVQESKQSKWSNFFRK